MSRTIVVALGVFVATWLFASVVFFFAYARPAIETKRAIAVTNAAFAVDVSDLVEGSGEGAATPLVNDGFDPGIICISAGMRIEKRCRTIEAAQQCAQLACKAGFCDDPQHCDSAELYDAALCSQWETRCGIEPPGGGGPPGSPPPGLPDCEPFDLVCNALDGLLIGVREALDVRR